MPPPIPVEWEPRLAPLAPVAVLATEASALQLARRLLARSPSTFHGVAGHVATPNSPRTPVLVVMGSAETLPWVDGAIYLGKDSAAPALLVPTILSPCLPIALLERAIARRAGPVVYAFTPKFLVPLIEEQAIVRERLEHWHQRFSC